MFAKQMKTLRGFTIGVGAVALMLALVQIAPAGTLIMSDNLGTALNPIYAFTSSDGSTVSGTWTAPAGITDFKVLVVGGGGGGGRHDGGGGGAGGVVYSTTFAVTAGVYNITVGAGGAGASCDTNTGATNGSDSFFDTLQAYGGGYGAGRTSGDNQVAAASGGSGGGGGEQFKNGAAALTLTPMQGYAGGTYTADYKGGGGGGAGGVGGNSGTDVAGAGGIGVDYSAIFGTSVGDSGWFAGGGGGAAEGVSITSAGGQGGGGAGGIRGDPYTLPTAGVSGTGGGGGAGTGYGNDQSYGAAGGSGIVLITYTPEPATMALLGLGGLGLVLGRKRR